MKEKKEDWSLAILGIIFIVIILIVFVGYFKNVSIGEWIAKENYDDKSEWYKQLGLFIATMAGFSYFLGISLDLLEYLPKKRKKGGVI